MSQRPEFLRNSLIVGAHPDDELLWFTAILRDVDRVITVYEDFWAHPALGDRRRAALADYPREIVSLGMDESGAYGCADWASPRLSEYGLAFGLEAKRRAATRVVRRSLSMVRPSGRTASADSVERAYEANFHRIANALEPHLASDMNVFTHNPWGEYGHEEHVQLFRVLDMLRDRIGFRLWMSNYCTDRALPLAMRYFQVAPGRHIRLPADKAFADEVASVYKKHGCWTWADDWAWFDEECYMEAPRADAEPAPHRHLLPLNLFTIDAERPKNWLPVALTMSVASAAVGVTLADAI